MERRGGSGAAAAPPARLTSGSDAARLSMQVAEGGDRRFAEEVTRWLSPEGGVQEGVQEGRSGRAAVPVAAKMAAAEAEAEEEAAEAEAAVAAAAAAAAVAAAQEGEGAEAEAEALVAA